MKQMNTVFTIKTTKKFPIELIFVIIVPVDDIMQHVFPRQMTLDGFFFHIIPVYYRANSNNAMMVTIFFFAEVNE